MSPCATVVAFTAGGEGEERRKEGRKAGTHKRTYRIRSILHSEFVLHIIVSTAYNSTVFQVQMYRFYKK